MSAPGWPARLAHESVALRPFRSRDAAAWSEVRIRNQAWLAPWEGRSPSGSPASWRDRNSAAVFAVMLRTQRKEARAGRVLSFAVTVDGRISGHVTVGGVTRGAFDSAHVGYWVDERVAGRGVMTCALALALDHCYGPVGLHRVEANVRPENAASLRVLAKLGFRAEGLHRRYLFIDEAWRDHLAFALLVEDVRGGALRTLLQR
ncbi:MAG: GNAT family N-acetyltransferase [Actinomycetota bacterium]|nr:GNAT family N-acetyltransferase [Actinomycetota bacterium]